MPHHYEQLPQEEDVPSSAIVSNEVTHSSGHPPTNSNLVPTLSHGLELPEALAHLSVEERGTLEKRLKRKIDLRLMPMVTLIYVLNYIDRNNLAAARIAGAEGKGIQDELGLSDVQYETAISILFVGYIMMQVPSNLLLARFAKPAIYLPLCMAIWGFLSLATFAVHSYGALVALRFLLGFVEAAYFPGVLFFLSGWYTRKELSLRTAALFSGALVAGAISGVLSAVVTDTLDGVGGLRAWRWLFVVEGNLTILVSLSAFFVLPNFPHTTHWLTPTERALAIHRLALDAGTPSASSSSSTSPSWRQNLLAALRDPTTPLLAAICTPIVFVGSVQNFLPSILRSTLGSSASTTLLLTVPPYALAVLATLLNARHADATRERTLHVAVPLAVGAIAFALASTSSFSDVVRYAALICMLPGTYAAYVVALAWISNSIPAPAGKRAAALAGINAVSNASSIFASYMYAGEDYTMPLLVNAALLVVGALAALALRRKLKKMNRELDKVECADATGEDEGEGTGFRYLT